MINQIESYLESLIKVLKNLDTREIEICCDVILEAREKSRNIFICGNGGSAATASHFACDINKGVSLGLDKRFKVIPLTDNFSTITAYSNDINYECVFLEQLKNYFEEGDVLIAISGSGNSKNIINVVDYVNKHNGITIGWTGFDGGILKKISKYSMNANEMDMQRSEDVHMIYVHILMKVLRKKLTGSEDYI